MQLRYGCGPRENSAERRRDQSADGLWLRDSEPRRERMPSFHLQIISPQRVEFDGDVESLVAPGEDGYLGVLTSHAPLLTTLKDGSLTFRTHGGAGAQ